MLNDDDHALVAEPPPPEPRPTPWLRTGIIVVVAAVVAVGTYLVLRPSDDATPATQVGIVLDATTAARSARFSVDATDNTDSPPRHDLAEGAMDFSRHTLQAHTRTEGSDDEEADMVVVGDAFYWRTTGDTTWTKFDFSSFSDSSEPSTSPADELNPQNLLDRLRRAGGVPKVVGTEEVRGVRATHEVLQVDPSAFDSESSGEPFDVGIWVDGKGRLVRAEFTDQQQHLLIEFYDYGVPVNVVAPADADVVDPFNDPGGSFSPGTACSRVGGNPSDGSLELSCS
jgi:hypothetical protein